MKKNNPLGSFQTTMMLGILLLFTSTFFLLFAISVQYDLDLSYLLSEVTKGARARESFRIMLGFCIFLICGIAFIITRLQLTHFREFKKAMHELANGKYETRLEFDFKAPSEFHELAESFNTMAKELNSTELLRKDFINEFSHEFKTPIVSIRGFAKVLQSKTASPEEETEYLQIINAETERLSRLSQNILMLCKIENQTIVSNKIKYELSEQIRQSIVLLAGEWEKKGINFDLRMDEVDFIGNKELLEQMFLNLIDNAIKFSPQQADILIDLKKESKDAVFRITDFGEGIEEEIKRRVFDKFYQGDASHATNGNGIGLSIVQRVAQLHGGTILVDSVVGQGTTFTIKLPIIT